MASIAILLLCSSVLFSVFTTASAGDILAANQTLKDGETIVSAGKSFELGFFSPSDTSQDRYLGIWYKKLASGTVVWVANRETPLTNTSGVLTLDPTGILALQNVSGGVVWSPNASVGSLSNPVVQLLDTGNLIIRDENDSDLENIVWQSFDHPGDTFLPGMKLGVDLVTGLDRQFTSWKSATDPSPGDYVVWMDLHGYPQIFRKKDSVVEARLGPWNGLRFSGLPSLKPNPLYTFEFVFNQTDVFYKFELVNPSVLSRMVLAADGTFQRFSWNGLSRSWTLYLNPDRNICFRYALCGANGFCNSGNAPGCGCLRGFEPKLPSEWVLANASSGCIRNIALDCKTDGFRKYPDMKLPDTRQAWFDQSKSLDECEMLCKRNCSCSAYANMNISDRTGCFLWFDDLMDMNEFPGNGQDIYIRMAASELENDTRSRKTRLVIVITIPLLVAIAITIGLCLLLVYKKRKLKEKGNNLPWNLGQDPEEDSSNGRGKSDIDLPLFSSSTLLAATSHFSFNNKIGEGGYGPVYKGILEDGREIAVKRLSETSTQGLEEFKNEVICISKLQHRNLVKLLGCCIQEDEKMLIYEYMPNKGLDSFIFDETKSNILDWPKRFDIINGIARGLLYLHEDSRLRIVHRDLKAGNILLDLDMNPKISDFGMARSFGGNDTETNTKRVVGTYGYMSPEYAGHGIFSIKSDVFSFGVLVLEIVSGKKNRGFFHKDHHHNLLGHAWLLHNNGESLELVDLMVTDSICVSQVLRSIHIALLCVQQRPEDRPTMSSVVKMFGSEGRLPQPKQPGFFTESSKFGPESSSSMEVQNSTNDFTITLVHAR